MLLSTPWAPGLSLAHQLSMLQVGGQGESPQADHYTPMLDPSSRRVDYLDLATPQSASRSFQAMHRPGQRAPSPTHPHRPQASLLAGDTHMYPPPPPRVPPTHNVGRQIAPFRRRQNKRPGVREHDREVYEVLLPLCKRKIVTVCLHCPSAMLRVQTVHACSPSLRTQSGLRHASICAACTQYRNCTIAAGGEVSNSKCRRFLLGSPCACSLLLWTRFSRLLLHSNVLHQQEPYPEFLTSCLTLLLLSVCSCSALVSAEHLQYIIQKQC